MSAELHSDILAFRNYLRAERGLSENTVMAYGRDLKRFAEWTETIRLADHLTPTLKELARYLGYLLDANLAAPSLRWRKAVQISDHSASIAASPSSVAAPRAAATGSRATNAAMALTRTAPIESPESLVSVALSSAAPSSASPSMEARRNGAEADESLAIDASCGRSAASFHTLASRSASVFRVASGC